MKTILTILMLALLVFGPAGAQEVHETNDRSITVSPTFYVQSPTAFQDVVRRLESILTAAADPGPVNSDLFRALSNIQGTTAQSSAFSFQGANTAVVPLPPETQTITKIDTDGEGNQTRSITETTTSKTQVLTEKGGATAPGLTGASSPAGLGLSAQDLLDAMIDLELYKTALNYTFRRVGNQAYWVAAFEVDIAPREYNRNEVAEILFTINDPEVDYVAHFPEKRTYNVVELVEDISNIGFGIVLFPFSFNAGSSNAEKTVYLVKDSEIVSVGPFRNGEKDQFGWQIRPVLGREYVTPGRRKLLVILKRPDPGPSTHGAVSFFPENEKQFFAKKVEVTARWRDIDRDSGIPTGITRNVEVNPTPSIVWPAMQSPEIVNVGQEASIVEIGEKRELTFYGRGLSPIRRLTVGSFLIPSASVFPQRVKDITTDTISDRLAMETATPRAVDPSGFTLVDRVTFELEKDRLQGASIVSIVTDAGVASARLDHIFPALRPSTAPPPPPPTAENAFLVSRSPLSATVRVEGSNLTSACKVHAWGKIYTGDQLTVSKDKKSITFSLAVGNEKRLTGLGEFPGLKVSFEAPGGKPRPLTLRKI